MSFVPMKEDPLDLKWFCLLPEITLAEKLNSLPHGIYHCTIKERSLLGKFFPLIVI